MFVVVDLFFLFVICSWCLFSCGISLAVCLCVYDLFMFKARCSFTCFVFFHTYLSIYKYFHLPVTCVSLFICAYSNIDVLYDYSIGYF